MITIFNRRELALTWDLARQAAIRDALAANGIEYVVKTVNTQAANLLGATRRARIGSLGIQSQYVYQYKIYVKKTEYEMACHLIRDVK